MKTISAIVVTHNRKDMLDACLRTLLANTVKPTELIIIDNGSTDGTGEMVKSRYPAAKYVRNENNNLAAVARNLGMKLATGDYLLVVDDDNEVDPHMIEELVRLCESDPTIGMAGPKMYCYGADKLISFAGADIDSITSRTYYRGSGTIDSGKFEEPCETGHIPNLQIIRRTMFEKIGGLDESYRMTYAESDFPMRARKAGFKVMYCPKAITYHKAPIPTLLKPDGSNVLLFRSPMRAYYLARNRVVYMKRYSTFLQFLLFFVVFFPAGTLYYTYESLRVARKSEFAHMRDYSALKMHLLGSWDGFIHGLTGRLRDRCENMEPD